MMSVEKLIEDLWKDRERLRNWSIFLLAPHEDDYRHGMVLLVDGQSGEPDDFLAELKRMLVDCKEGFALEEHKGDFGGRHAREHADPMTPVAWVKIALEERYPFRLFVAIEPSKWKHNDVTPLDAGFWSGIDPQLAFLRKRICWLNSIEFADKVRPIEPEKLKSHLRFLWLRHLLEELRDSRQSPWNSIYLKITLEESDPTGRGIERLDPPLTVPSVWRDSKGRTPSKATGGYSISIADEQMESDGADPSDTTTPIILVNRHDIGSTFERASCAKWSLRNGGQPIIYQTAVSGAGQIFSVLVTLLAASAGGKMAYGTQSVLLDVAEQAILRIGIADERFHQWFAKLPTERERGWVLAQRVAPVFLEGAGKYGQADLRPHLWWNIKGSESGGGQNSSITIAACAARNVEGLDCLWPEGERRLDLLIIHQGLLDKWCGDRGQGGSPADIISSLREKIPFIVVTSGRGRPENLPPGCKFFPYSGIEGAIHGVYFEKLALWWGLGSV